MAIRAPARTPDQHDGPVTRTGAGVSATGLRVRAAHARPHRCSATGFRGVVRSYAPDIARVPDDHFVWGDAIRRKRIRPADTRERTPDARTPCSKHTGFGGTVAQDHRP